MLVSVSAVQPHVDSEGTEGTEEEGGGLGLFNFFYRRNTNLKNMMK